MPDPLYHHPCCTPEAEPDEVRTHCPICGAPPRVARWGFRKAELLSRYQEAFGLAYAGPHRPLADRLLAPLRERCGRCDGIGCLDTGSAVERCTVCDGAGGRWSAPEEVIASHYRAIVRRFPDAARAGVISELALVPARASRPPGDRLGTGERSPRRKRARRKPRPRKPKEFSPDGLRYVDVQCAFLEAEQRLGIGWHLKGRGHCRRATLKATYARAVNRVARSGEYLMPRFTTSRRTLYPVAIIEEAARILDVDPGAIMGREY